MIKLWKTLIVPVSWPMDGVSARAQALLQDMTKRVDKAVSPPSPGVVIPTEFKLKRIERDEVQLVAEAKNLPPEAQQLVTDLKGSLDRLQEKLKAGKPIAVDDPDLVAYHKANTELSKLLASGGGPSPTAPPVDMVNAKGMADSIANFVKGNRPDDIKTWLQMIDNPGEMRAVLDILQKDKGLSYLDLFKAMGNQGQDFIKLTAASMSTEQRAAAIKQFADGYTPDAQEQAIVAIFQAAQQQPGDTPALLDALKAKGMSYLDLFKEMDSDENQAALLQATAGGMTTQQQADAIHEFARGYTPASQEKAMSVLLGSARDPVTQQGLLDELGKRGIDTKRIYSELQADGLTTRFENNFRFLNQLKNQHVPLTVEGLQQRLLDQIPEEKRALVEVRLESLQEKGKLTPELLMQLNMMLDPSQTPIARKPDGTEALDRKDLLLETLDDLSYPPHINQCEWGTCGATRVQAALAMRDPGRYVEMLRLLASPAGDASAILPGLKRPADQDLSAKDELKTHDGTKVVGEGTRSLTVRLLSPAIMNYGSEGHYNNASDIHKFDANDIAHADHDGMTSAESARAIAGVLGVKADEWDVNPARSNVDDVMKQLDAATGRGSVPVDLRWGSASHAVLYVGSAVDPASGKQVAMIANPWGELQSMPMDEFKDRLQRAFVPQAGQDPIPRPENWQDVSNFPPLPDWRFMSSSEVMKHSPGFDKMDPTAQGKLAALVGNPNFSASTAEVLLRPLLAAGKVDGDMVDRLQGVMNRHNDKDGSLYLARQMRNFNILDQEPSFKALDPALQKRALDALASSDLDSDSARGLAMLAKAGKLDTLLLNSLDAWKATVEARNSSLPAGGATKPADVGEELHKLIDATVQAQVPAKTRFSYTLGQDPGFQKLPADAQRKLLDALGAQKVAFSDATVTKILARLADGKLTPATIKASSSAAIVKLINDK